MNSLNLFSLHGKYFDDDENRFTANVLFLFSEFRSSFLPAFLDRCGAPPARNTCTGARIRFQVPHRSASGDVRIPDGEIRLDDDLHVLIEAKIGNNPLMLDQITDYATHLATSSARSRKLVCITQMDCFCIRGLNVTFEELKVQVEPAIVPAGTCVWLRWFEVLDILKSSLGLTPENINKDERRIAAGKDVAYGRRLGALFLKEVETAMYDRKEIDSLPHGDVEDVVLSVQNGWFMDVALRHRVWFPNNLGGRASRYVAHYETADSGNQNPSQIAYMARNRSMWNRITIQEAVTVPELQHAFADPVVMAEVGTWPPESKHCIVLTDEPVRLREPLQLGSKRFLARIMPGRFVSLPVLRNAHSIDDLY
jgi:hypothetical protein